MNFLHFEVISLILALIFSTKGIDGTRTKTKTICEGEKEARVACPLSKKLKIVSLFYGRDKKEVCSADSTEKQQNTECSLRNVDHYFNDAKNQTSYTFKADRDFFDVDPCPETYKYLRIAYECVSHVFECPGTLTGIRSMVTLDSNSFASMDGWWSKDPQKKKSHIYHHHDSQPFIKDCVTEQAFLNGGCKNNDLQIPLKSAEMTVYNGYLYYYISARKAVARYKMLFQQSQGYNDKFEPRKEEVHDAHLSSDEDGLWMTYRLMEGQITIVKLNQDLTVEQRWHTGITATSSGRVIICGVMYVLTSSSTITFNTLTGVTSQFASLRDPHNVFSNATNIHYNAMERLFYGWSQGQPVYFQLTFSHDDPKTDKPVSSTTKPTTLFPKIQQSTCPEQFRRGLLFPETESEDIVKVSCGVKTAYWKCKVDIETGEGRWQDDGPDVSECYSSFTYVIKRMNEGDTTAAEFFPAFLKENINVMDKSEIFQSTTAVFNFITLFLQNSKKNVSLQLAETIIEALNALTSKSSLQIISMTSLQNRCKFFNEITDSIKLVLHSTVLIDRLGEFQVVKNNLLARVQAYDYSKPYYYNFPGNQSFQDNEVSFTFPSQHKTVIARLKESSLLSILVMKHFGDFFQNENDGKSNWRVDSDVVDLSLASGPGTVNLEQPIRVVLRHKKVTANWKGNKKRQCVYWKHNSNTQPAWSTEGCHLVHVNGSHSTCECNHLSTFAVQVDKSQEKSDAQIDVTYLIAMSIGISVSCVCLILCFTTFVIFKDLQDDVNFTVKHFSLMLFVAETSYMVAIHQPSDPTLCHATAFLLHLSLLATFVWLALESFQIFALLGEFVDSTASVPRWKWFYLIGYGMPTMVVMTTALINIEGYKSPFWCWLNVNSYSMLGFIFPLVVAVLTTAAMLVATTVKLHRKSSVLTDATRLKSVRYGVRSTGSLLFILGLTWMFGLVWNTEKSVIIAYLFLILNVFLGFFVFFVYCILQGKVRREYLKLFRKWTCCQGKSSIGEMTYVSNSMSFSKHYNARNNRYNQTGTSPNYNHNQNHSQLQRMWTETVGSCDKQPNQPTETSTMIYNSDTAPNRELQVANHYAPSRRCQQSSHHDLYLEPQSITHQQDSRHRDVAYGYHHHSNSRSDPEEGQYDRLRRNERVEDDFRVQQNGDDRVQTGNPYTINNNQRVSTSGSSIPDSSLLSYPPPRANTVSKISAQWTTDDNSVGSSIARDKRPIYNVSNQKSRRRSSMNSTTEESDITNDASSSSFDGRSRYLKTHKMQTRDQLRQQKTDRWTPITPKEASRDVDENDLEVERCLFSQGTSSRSSNNEVVSHPAASSERDSAFYQSLPELNNQNSVPEKKNQQNAAQSILNCYSSSPSSGCGSEMKSCDENSSHQHFPRRALENSLRTTQRVYEEVQLPANHSGVEDCLLASGGDDRLRPTYVLTKSVRQNGKESNNPQPKPTTVIGGISNSHLQTCL